MQDYLSAREAARHLKISYSTLMSWIYDSKIRASRRGRWWFLLTTDVEKKAAELAA